jgi:hypothetical protein
VADTVHVSFAHPTQPLPQSRDRGCFPPPPLQVQRSREEQIKSLVRRSLSLERLDQELAWERFKAQRDEIVRLRYPGAGANPGVDATDLF